MAEPGWLRLCAADALQEGGEGVRFPVQVAGRTATGFAVRHRGVVVGYLNQCAHVAMELDWQPGRFFDGDGQWLVCATHGALYAADSGRCVGGPCAGRGSLRSIAVTERDGSVFWRPDEIVQAVLSSQAPG